ncbi:MAG TPA: Hpt domain-containing protein, partial [Janthinobacterium sp.]|nr:Hpt domain-containing protein [Janthinobacterium sp.]
GYEATRLIRSHPQLAGTLVIAMTANAGREDQARCIGAGMDEFITKPISPNLLFSVLAKWMTRHADETLRGTSFEPSDAPRPARTTAAAMREQPAPAAAAPPPEAAMLDLAALAQTFGDRQDKMRKYALLFLDAARGSLAEINEAAERGDLERLADLGHRTKSSAKAVGAMRFAALCHALEGLRHSGDVAGALLVVGQLQPLLDRLSEQIIQEFAESDARLRSQV